jgi:hypothetical protein
VQFVEQPLRQDENRVGGDLRVGVGAVRSGNGQSGNLVEIVQAERGVAGVAKELIPGGGIARSRQGSANGPREPIGFAVEEGSQAVLPLVPVDEHFHFRGGAAPLQQALQNLLRQATLRRMQPRQQHGDGCFVFSFRQELQRLSQGHERFVPIRRANSTQPQSTLRRGRKCAVFPCRRNDPHGCYSRYFRAGNEPQRMVTAEGRRE